MATIQTATYQLIEPVSATDSNYEEYEYMLFWFGRDGSPIQYLFTDWEETQRVRANPLNVQDKDIMRNIISMEERPVILVAEDLTLNDLKVLSSINVAKKIIRLYKDGTFERVGLVPNTVDWRQTDGRYNLEFELMQYEKPLAK